ncbi:hypothetical protein BAE44_0020408, partial [Dichanthelium oligosanthes]
LITGKWRSINQRSRGPRPARTSL